MNLKKLAIFSTGITLSVLGLFSARPASAVILIEDNFDRENNGRFKLNYNNFQNWNVTEGSVDLIGSNGFPINGRNGKYVDLDGSTGIAGTLESKSVFSFNTDDTVKLQFVLAGNGRPARDNTSDSVNVSLGSLFSETFTKNPNDPFETIMRSFTVSSPTDARLSFDHAGGDRIGLILDDVKLEQVPEPMTILGSLAALGMGMLLKKEYSKTKNSPEAKIQ